MKTTIETTEGSALEPRGCKVSIKGANQFLMDLFEMTGFKRWFNFV